MFPTKSGSFGHVVSEEKIFSNSPIRNNNRPWWPCLLMEYERNKYSLQRTSHRCFLPSFGSFGQAVSEEKNFKNQPIRNKNCLWWSCLSMDRDGMSNLIEDLPQMLPTKFRFIWLSGFREDFKKQTNQKQELPVVAMFVNGSGQNEQSLQRTYHICFLPSFSSYG